MSVLLKLYFSYFCCNNCVRFTQAVFQLFWPWQLFPFYPSCISALLVLTTVSDILTFPAVSAVQPSMGLCSRCLSEFIDCRKPVSCVGTFSYVDISNPALFSSVLPFSPSLWFNSPPPSPLPCLNTTVYTYTVCKGRGVWGSGPQTDKHLPQSLQVNFFRWRLLRWCLRVYS